MNKILHEKRNKRKGENRQKTEIDRKSEREKEVKKEGGKRRMDMKKLYCCLWNGYLNVYVYIYIYIYILLLFFFFTVQKRHNNRTLVEMLDDDIDEDDDEDDDQSLNGQIPGQRYGLLEMFALEALMQNQAMILICYLVQKPGSSLLDQWSGSPVYENLKKVMCLVKTEVISVVEFVDDVQWPINKHK